MGSLKIGEKYMKSEIGKENGIKEKLLPTLRLKETWNNKRLRKMFEFIY